MRLYAVVVTKCTNSYIRRQYKPGTFLGWEYIDPEDGPGPCGPNPRVGPALQVWKDIKGANRLLCRVSKQFLGLEADIRVFQEIPNQDSEQHQIG